MGDFRKVEMSDLNGRYRVNYHTKDMPQDWFEYSVADLVVDNGKFIGTDKGGCGWLGAIEMMPSGTSSVSFSATVDTKDAHVDTYLQDGNGDFTKETQRYSGVLAIISFDGDITMKGVVQHGKTEIIINMSKVFNE